MKTRLRTVRIGVWIALGFCLWPAGAGAIKLEDPENFEVANTWSSTTIGVPGPLGGMLFSEDGNTLYVVGNSENSSSALYAVAVTRDPETGRVTDLGPADSTTTVFSGTQSGLDTGLEIGPNGTLFYTYWSANYMGQRPGGMSGDETLYNMGSLSVGVPSSVAGLTFSPHIQDETSAYGQMQVSSWQGANLYNIPLTPAEGGLYTPGTAVLFVTLPQQGTGAIQYVPSGKYAGNLMYVNWNYGEVRVLMIDPDTGLPIDADSGEPALGTTNPVDEVFASEMGVGPWGLEFDSKSNDFFVSTWSGNPANTIIQFTGIGFAPEPEPDAGVSDAGDASVDTPDAGPVATDASLQDASQSDAGDAVADSDGGCGCRTHRSSRRRAAFVLLLLTAVFALRRRRRR